jgi:two-component system, LytTR family, response regulator LytT
MTLLRALVVEDEWPARNYLVELLQQTGRTDVVAAVSTIDEARQALEPTSGAAVDAAFVDVRLKSRKQDQSGLAWLRAATRAPGAPMFVLATAHREHAVEAFDLGVVDYLLKPFTAGRVSDAVDRLLARRGGLRTDEAPTPLRIAARRDRVLVFLEMQDVWACEAAERLTFVHSSRGRFDLDLTLSAIGVSFGRMLLRAHRNWLVNPARVLEFERGAGETTLLVGSGQPWAPGVRVPVAKERAVAVRDALLSGTRGVRQS